MPETIHLSHEHLEAFEQQGVLHLHGFYPWADIQEMAHRLWADLEARYGMVRDRPESWTVAAPAQFQTLKRAGAFSALGSPKLFALADTLLGVGAWEMPARWGGPLVTFPTRSPILRRPPWHLDVSGAEQLVPLPVLRVFTFLEPLAPGGGGTLYVAGSHHLAIEVERAHGAPVQSAQVRDRLKAEHPWFAGLLATPTANLRRLVNVDVRIGSQTLRLEEMTGDPGDLIVMHPALLHGTSHNALDRPRMMLTEWIRRREVPAP